MEHIGVKFLYPSGVATMGASTPTAWSGSGFLIGSMLQPRMEPPPRLGLGTINISPLC